MSHKSDTSRLKRAEQLLMLQKSNKRLSDVPLVSMLNEPDRFEQFSRRLPGLLLDFSRLHLDRVAFDQLLELARVCEVTQRRDALFSGEAVNETEGRAALHMALRCPQLLARAGGGEAQAVRRSQEQLQQLAQGLGKNPAQPGAADITDIVHIGIGGSLLGPQLLSQALASDVATPRVHFLGSVDAHYREQLLQQLDPKTTVVILVSKSFTTGDTMMHGARLKNWLRRGLGEDVAPAHLYAVTSRVERAEAFGIPAQQILYFPEWVGGRYSLWSPVSLSAVAQMGNPQFQQLLAGARAMDTHFCQAPLESNLPVLMALFSIWHRNICGHAAWGVMPYDQRLGLLPAFLQQLIMESNGKSVSMDGEPVAQATSPVVFGEIGTDAQHSVFQAMHQGSDVVPLHFVGVINPDHSDLPAHNQLLANLLAQATALACGRDLQHTREATGETHARLLAQRVFAGNRPSEIILLDRLNAFNLGQLLALYEHRTFVESVLWGINAFDQWGVELGKTLIPDIEKSLGQPSPDNDAKTPASLRELLAYVRHVRD